MTHALWVIALLILAIAALLLKVPDGNVVRDYMSFATSLTSLILSVVAIFYAVVSNQGLSQSIGVLHSSSTSLQEAARSLAETSAKLSDQSEKMIGEVSKVPDAVNALSAKIETRVAQEQVLTDPEHSDQASKTLDFFYNAVLGGRVTLYVLALSVRESKAFDPYKIFENKAVWSNLVCGGCHMIKAFAPYGLKLVFLRTDKSFLFSVSEVSEFPFNEVISAFEGPDLSGIEEERQQIASYFGLAVGASG